MVRTHNDAGATQDQTTPLSPPRLRRGGARASLFAKVPDDGRVYHVRLLEYVLIIKTEDGEAFLSQVLLAFAIVIAAGGVVVDGAIQFDDQALRRAVEIDNVRTDAVLAAKLAAIEPAFLQPLPQRTLGGCSSVAQLLASLPEVLSVVERPIRWIRHSIIDELVRRCAGGREAPRRIPRPRGSGPHARSTMQ